MSSFMIRKHTEIQRETEHERLQALLLGSVRHLSLNMKFTMYLAQRKAESGAACSKRCYITQMHYDAKSCNVCAYNKKGSL